MLSQNPDAILNRVVNIKTLLKEKLEKEQNEEEKEYLQMDIRSIDNIFESLEAYTRAVFLDEEKNLDLKRMKNTFNSVEEYQYKFEEIEKSRKSKHDTLIRAIKMADQTCIIHGVEPIYGELGEYAKDTSGLMGKENYNKPGVKECRRKLANWGFDFVLATTVALVVEKDVFDKREKDSNCFLTVANTLKKMNFKKDMVDITEEKSRHDHNPCAR